MYLPFAKIKKQKDHEVLPSLGFLDYWNGEVLTYLLNCDLSFLASCQIATQEINFG